MENTKSLQTFNIFVGQGILPSSAEENNLITFFGKDGWIEQQIIYQPLLQIFVDPSTILCLSSPRIVLGPNTSNKFVSLPKKKIHNPLKLIWTNRPLLNIISCFMKVLSYST